MESILTWKAPPNIFLSTSGSRLDRFRSEPFFHSFLISFFWKYNSLPLTLYIVCELHLFQIDHYFYRSWSATVFKTMKIINHSHKEKSHSSHESEITYNATNPAFGHTKYMAFTVGRYLNLLMVLYLRIFQTIWAMERKYISVTEFYIHAYF